MKIYTDSLWDQEHVEKTVAEQLGNPRILLTSHADYLHQSIAGVNHWFTSLDASTPWFTKITEDDLLDSKQPGYSGLLSISEHH
jgi:hypothetical protein